MKERERDREGDVRLSQPGESGNKKLSVPASASLTRSENRVTRIEFALASLQQHLSGLSVFVYACGQAQDTASTKFSVSLAELLPDRVAVRVFVHITPCSGTRNVQKGRQGPSWRGS